MTGPVTLLAGDGQVRVGAATFPGGPLPDGRVGLLGVALRRLGLAERDRLVALAEDDPRALARLVGGAASDVTLPADDGAVAAIEAVALDLAGATRDGPLARTRLLTARVAGPGADELAAADADDLAAELARAVQQDDGWTRLELGALSDAGAGEPAEVRDRLARALLDRAHEPLDLHLVRRLLHEGAADSPEPQSWSTAPVDRSPGRPVGAVATASAPSPARPWTAHRDDPWSAADRGPGQPVAGRDQSTGRAGTAVAALAADRTASTTRTAPAPSTMRPTAPTGPASDWSAATSEQSVGAAPSAPPVPTVPVDLSAGSTPTAPLAADTPGWADRWGAPVGVAAPARVVGASDARSSWGTPRDATAAPAFAWSPAPIPVVAAPGAGPSSATALVAAPRPVTPPAVTVRASLDDVALALHRGADLRGVRR